MTEQQKSGRVKRSRLGRGLSALVETPAPIEVPAPEPKGPEKSNSQHNSSNIGDKAVHNTNKITDNDEHRSIDRHDESLGSVLDGAVVEIELGAIVANPDQPRRVFDEASLAELAASIAEHGLMQPVLVRRARSGGDGGGKSRGGAGSGYELIAGERRWRASKIAGLTRIPAMVRAVDDATSAQLALIENVQREDLDVIELAMGYRVLLERYSMTQEQIAKKVGVSRSSVANTVRLLDLPDEVITLVREGSLSTGHAKVLLSLGSPEKQRIFAARCMKMGWNVRELERAQGEERDGLVTDPAVSVRGDSSTDQAQSVLRDLERRVGEELGTRVRIRTDKSRTRGRVVIEFFDLDQFDGLLGRLGVKIDG